jgi:hypothetical protein
MPTTVHAAPLSGRSVPAQLRLRQAVIIALSLVLGLVGWITYQRHHFVVQTIGRDAVPSIVAAEKIRATLADAHTQVANAFLTKEGSAGPSMQAYGKSIAQAHDYLLLAAQNITYGEDERRPILALMNQVSVYERLIGMALSDKDQAHYLRQADALMREQILPAAVALDQANFAHLAQAYSEDKAKARNWLYGMLALALALAAVMLETQLKLYANFRRLVNLPIALGLASLVLGTLVFVIKVGHITSDVRSAKEDAFDSVHALSQAQATAYSANAEESIYLFLTNPEEQAQQGKLFREASKSLFSYQLDAGKNLPIKSETLKGHGLLADELANITYEGEEAAARETLEAWLEYRDIDSRIRALQESGRHAEALALCLGTQAHQSDWAFQKFDKALARTLEINQMQFEYSIKTAFQQLNWLLMLLIPVALFPLLGSVIGLRQRLAEFRE